MSALTHSAALLRLTVVLHRTGANDVGQAGRQHKQGQQDSEAGKEEDLRQLQAAAMERVNSQQVVIPTASRKHLKEVDVRKLTKSQKNMMLDEALQVHSTPQSVM